MRVVFFVNCVSLVFADGREIDVVAPRVAPNRYGRRTAWRFSPAVERRWCGVHLLQ